MIVMRRSSPVTDEEALLAAVAAAPLDDAPRLVYADWLQEQGADEEAEYVRAVVALSHPPEDRALVGRCVELAETLDADWRQAVGARFEVVVEGPASLVLFAYLFQVVLGLALDQPFDRWQHGQPVRVRGSLTREDAEVFLGKYQGRLTEITDQHEPPLKLVIRPANDDSTGSFLDS